VEAAGAASPESTPREETRAESEGIVSALPIVFAMTGASGAPYAVRLLEALAGAGQSVWLIVSSHGWRLLREECGIGTLPQLRKRVGPAWSGITLFDDSDRGARPASGSARTAGMVICPCSMGTMAAVAQGTSRSLVERAADVTLKERRRLVLVPRESPYSLVHLRNMTAVTEAGAVVLPASPGFYHRPAGIGDLVDFVVQRIADQLGVEIELVRRWGEKDARGGGGKGGKGGRRVAG
jgi:4-hydroxy-3-polyprenylbenzoate decarboxylase